MHAMQYQVTLPADYDMEIIRQRVATRGSQLDNFPGLGLKAYCIREKGSHGSPINQYCPFYLWNTIDGMNSFLWGPGFRGVCESFGRPTVRQWGGVAFRHGPQYSQAPTAASRRCRVLGPDEDAGAAVVSAMEDLEGRSQMTGVHSAALAIDTAAWELLDFTLWVHALPTVEETIYSVLHLSVAELDRIER